MRCSSHPAPARLARRILPLLLATTSGCATEGALHLRLPTVAQVAADRGCGAAEGHAAHWLRSEVDDARRRQDEHQRRDRGRVALLTLTTPLTVSVDLGIMAVVNLPFILAAAATRQAPSGGPFWVGFPVTRLNFREHPSPPSPEDPDSVEERTSRTAAEDLLRCYLRQEDTEGGSRAMARLLRVRGVSPEDVDLDLPERLLGRMGRRPDVRQLYLLAVSDLALQDPAWRPAAERVLAGPPAVATEPPP